jgi:hypothetical protein
MRREFLTRLFRDFVRSRESLISTNMSHRIRSLGLSHAAFLAKHVCEIAGDRDALERARTELGRAGVIEAVRHHDDAVLFDWLMDCASYQGIADAIAAGYMARHGRVTAAALETELSTATKCPKLRSYWDFHECGYLKLANACSSPAFFKECSLPKHDLRNGRLNQTAYALFLFLRDVAQNDLVAWIDRRLEQADQQRTGPRGQRLAAAIIRPLANIYGLSDKVLTMSLSWLLLVADPDRERWRCAGASMVAVDSLVHNWMHRTGALRELNAGHLYGLACYADHGCAEIIAELSKRIDAATFNAEFPSYFPRFVQHAIWRFCAQSELDRCNGNQINDRKRCGRDECELYRVCERVVLNPRS